MGVEPKDTMKPKRRKDISLLAASKENTGDLSQRSIFPNSKIGDVLSYRYMHIREGAWVVGRVQALVDQSHEGQKGSPSSSLRFQLVRWLSN